MHSQTSLVAIKSTKGNGCLCFLLFNDALSYTKSLFHGIIVEKLKSCFFTRESHVDDVVILPQRCYVNVLIPKRYLFNTFSI